MEKRDLMAKAALGPRDLPRPYTLDALQPASAPLTQGRGFCFGLRSDDLEALLIDSWCKVVCRPLNRGCAAGSRFRGAGQLWPASERASPLANRASKLCLKAAAASVLSITIKSLSCRLRPEAEKFAAPVRSNRPSIS